jgi:hypothetical protein
MEVNNSFIEALFTGLNHEMSRELLWREFPSDQRGSYLRKFWDRTDSTVAAGNTEGADDIANELHQWNSPLGSNIAVNSQRIVLVIRGQLLQKFPDTLIFASEAEFSGTPGISQEELKSAPRQMKTSGETIYPIFTARLGTDVTLLGFDLSVNEALGKSPVNAALGENAEWLYTADNAGYFFALQERPGQLRFGLDEEYFTSLTVRPSFWNQLSWDYIGDPRVLLTAYSGFGTVINPEQMTWGESSAEMANILFRKQLLFLTHSNNLI